MARILIVEDRPEIRTLLRAVAEREGHDVLVAADAAEADRLLCQEPALIFVDLGLPGGSGLDFAHGVRRISAMQHTPIVVVTAHPDARQQIEASGLRDIELVMKPFRFKEVLGIMENHLGAGG